MKILLDECLPRRLAKLFTGHDVKTVRQMNWLGLSNGRLLDAAADFDLFITVDKNIVQSPQVAGRRLAVMILRVKSNKIEDISHLMPNVLGVLADLKPGTLNVVP